MQSENRFAHLFRPLKIGNLTVRNRIYMTPHTLNYCEKLPGENIFVHSDKHIAYYSARAKGGVGLIITESNFVSPSADYHPLLLPSMFDSRCIPYLKKVTDAVHSYDTKIFVQLWHGGTHVKNNDRTNVVSLSPSAVSPVTMYNIPKEMELEDIQRIQEEYATAAAHVKEGGADGVEIHCTHTGLIEQFLSPFFNKRSDSYGGSLQNRMRFLFETLRSVRRSVGGDFTVGLRYIADEMLPGGLSNNDMADIAKIIENSGLVDFFDCDIGTYHALPLLYGMLNFVPTGFEVDYIATIKKALSKTPVLACIGKFSSPYVAEKILSDGLADMVGGARGHIADPEIVKKTLEGRAEDIIPCIACNVFCVDHIYRGLPVNCVLNPLTGRENELDGGTIKPAEKRKKVVVVGGGCGGMEAARILALRGHEVILFEKEQRLGGLLLTESRFPGRDIYLSAIQWFERQIRKNGVRIVTSKEADTDTVLNEKPDSVVVATGAHWDKSGITGAIAEPIPGWEQENVLTPDQVLKDGKNVGNRVLIFDEEGLWTAPSIAEILHDDGKDVEIVTRWFQVMSNMSTNVQSIVMYPRLFNKKIKLTPYTYIRGINGNSVTVFNIFTNEENLIENIDTVIFVTRKKPNAELYFDLKAKSKILEVYRIGDCVAPRWIGESIYEAHLLGRHL
jgi:2,4-dienoyl-CoA reductase-like NADH-dependent reductase (Old Yellow Enzyme family)/thioredoxin reductase